MQDMHLGKDVIGLGSSRRVYDLRNGYVAKVASGELKRMERGLAQNRAEYTMYETGQYDDITHLAPCQSLSNDETTLVMRKLIRADDYPSMTQKMRMQSLQLHRRLKFIDEIFWGAKKGDIPNRIKALLHTSKKEKHAEIRAFTRSKLFKDLMVIIFQYELLLGDICRMSSWGYYRGKYVLIDYGGTRTVFNEHYGKTPIGKGVAK